mgnify:CR=1 FL=1
MRRCACWRPVGIPGERPPTSTSSSSPLTLILIAIVLSTMMTAVIGQSAGVLSAMRQQQAITLGGNRYATFLQMNQEQVAALQNDSRLSFVGEYVTLGTTELNPSLSLGLKEYQEDVAAIYPTISRLKEGRLPEAPTAHVNANVKLFHNFTSPLWIFRPAGFEIPVITGASATSRIRIIPGWANAKAPTAERAAQLPANS